MSTTCYCWFHLNKNKNKMQCTKCEKFFLFLYNAAYTLAANLFECCLLSCVCVCVFWILCISLWHIYFAFKTSCRTIFRIENCVFTSFEFAHLFSSLIYDHRIWAFHMQCEKGNETNIRQFTYIANPERKQIQTQTRKSKEKKTEKDYGV